MNQDKTLVCKDCGKTFVFTASEQDFYAEKGFNNETTRCKDCRSARKSEGGFNRRSDSGYDRRSDSGYDRRGDSGSRKEMYPAVCSACGKKTQVPFQPKKDRPVYCSDCFAKQR
jgi:CxxC-x17-CxxC domain-containing protein